MSATVKFTTSINATAKTITLSVSDWDTIAVPGGSAYIYYTTVGSTEYTLIGTHTTTASTENIAIYYSGCFSLSSGEDDVIPDGVYVFYVSDNDTAPTSTDEAVYLYTDINTRCCLSSRIAKMMEDDFDDCKKDNCVKELFFLKLLLEGASYDGTTSCGDWTEAYTKLSFVQDICNQDEDCLNTGCR